MSLDILIVGSHPKLCLRFGLDSKLLWPGQSIEQQASSLFLEYQQRGLLYGTDLNSLDSFSDVIFSLMRKICYTQYINYKKQELQGDMVVEW